MHAVVRVVAIVVPIAAFLGLLTLALLTAVAISYYFWKRNQQRKTEGDTN